MPYRVEYAKSARAVCKFKACKDAAVKIDKGELRLGVWVEYKLADTASWAWRHWGCVTPAQCKNLRDGIDDDCDNLDGYDEINDEDRARIRKALTDGHIADEDLREGLSPEDNRDKAAIKAAATEANRVQKERDKAEKLARKQEAKAQKDVAKEAKNAEATEKKAAKAEATRQKAIKAKKMKHEDEDGDDSKGNGPNKKRSRAKVEESVKEEPDEDHEQSSASRSRKRPKAKHENAVKEEDRQGTEDLEAIPEEVQDAVIKAKPNPKVGRGRATKPAEDSAPAGDKNSAVKQTSSKRRHKVKIRPESGKTEEALAPRRSGRRGTAV